MQSQIDQVQYEFDSFSQANQTMSNFSVKTEDIDEIRRQLAQTSIELEENRERYKRTVAKK